MAAEGVGVFLKKPGGKVGVDTRRIQDLGKLWLMDLFGHSEQEGLPKNIAITVSDIESESYLKTALMLSVSRSVRVSFRVSHSMLCGHRILRFAASTLLSVRWLHPHHSAPHLDHPVPLFHQLVFLRSNSFW